MNEHRENSSQRNYLSKHFIRKHIILSLKAIRVILTGSWIISQPFHASKSGRRHQMSTPKSVSSRIKHLWNNYKYLNFHLKTELPWPLMCKLYVKILWLWFLFRTGQAFHREETNQVEGLEGKSVFSWKLLFFFFHLKKTDRWFFWTFRFSSVLKQCIQPCIERRHNKTHRFFSWQTRTTIWSYMTNLTNERSLPYPVRSTCSSLFWYSKSFKIRMLFKLTMLF